MHGGIVTAASAGPGKGSEFTVRIPCRTEEHRPAAAVVEHQANTNGKPRRILVVDDNQDAADSLMMLMQMRGFEVRVAYDGQTAIDIATKEKPAIILLDIGLPGIDGYEVCRRMRQQGLSDTCIIALTGYGQDRDRERSKEAGFDLHTVKPIKIDELVRLIAEG